MKITAFDDLYPNAIGTGSTILYGATGSNSGITGGDVVGEPGDMSVVRLASTVSLGSNLATGVALGDVLTIIQASPATARFATPSNTAAGSNSVTRTLGGQETIVTHNPAGTTRNLDVRGGNVFDLTLATNTTIDFIGEPSGVSCAITTVIRQDGTGGWDVTWPGSVVWPSGATTTVEQAASAVSVFTFFTLDTGTTWFGFPAAAGAPVSAGSNSTHVRETSTAGVSTSFWSPFDHAHAGVAQVTSSSSNTLQRGTVNIRAGTNVGLTATDTDGDGEFDTVTIHSTGGGTGAAGAMTMISDTTLGSDTANFDLTSIPGTYKHLRIYVSGRSDRGAPNTGDLVSMRFNNDSGSNYDSEYFNYANTTANAGESMGATAFSTVGQFSATSAPANAAGHICIDIPDYAGTTFNKTATAQGSVNLGTGTSGQRMMSWAGHWRSNVAITRVTIYPAAGTNFKTGSRCTLYGIS